MYIKILPNLYIIFVYLKIKSTVFTNKINKNLFEINKKYIYIFNCEILNFCLSNQYLYNNNNNNNNIRNFQRCQGMVWHLFQIFNYISN